MQLASPYVTLISNIQIELISILHPQAGNTKAFQGPPLKALSTMPQVIHQ